MAQPGTENEVWAVIPAKPFAVGKSRIALAGADREALNRRFLHHVLSVACEVLPARRVVVVSRDEQALMLARSAGARALREDKESDLNHALAMGARFAEVRGARGVLSLFTDLPYLEPDDLERMIGEFDGRNLVIAPNEEGGGSNALLMAPGAIPYAHGTGSFWRHVASATEAKAELAVVERRGLARDVDTVEQLSAYLADPKIQDLRIHHPYP
jgi:2-phospho-L-lactate/phosphoenolpyruvate guanylyltransferase